MQKDEPKQGISRFEFALQVADELLMDLEMRDVPIDRCILKAKRFARLINDQDAQNWLDFEIKGYPNNFNFSQLGSCQKYVESGGTLNTADGKYWKQSLPELEASVEAEKQILKKLDAKMQIPAGVENYIASGATINVMNSHFTLMQGQKKNYINTARLFSSLKSSLHAYISESYITMKFGDIAQTIFEEARQEVDSFIRSKVPRAAEQIVAINERLQEDNPESRIAALSLCRRLLLSLADVVFPAQEEPYIDSRAQIRSVSGEQYKNRLLAFLDSKLQKSDSSEILESEIDYLAARLNSVYQLTCKGIHADVSESEAKLVMIHTYLFAAEIARLAK